MDWSQLASHHTLNIYYHERKHMADDNTPEMSRNPATLPDEVGAKLDLFKQQQVKPIVWLDDRSRSGQTDPRRAHEAP
jgi:hypothetical protein